MSTPARSVDPLARVLDELERAYAKHGSEPWGRHEFSAILREEYEEAWDAIKDDEPQEHLLKEVAQVAAVCLRYLETGDRHRGPHYLDCLSEVNP